MPLLAVLDEAAHGGLDESLKTLYKQNTENKNFYLDIVPDEAAKLAFTLQTQFENKKKELTAKHTELNTLKAEVDGYAKIGKTPDEIKELIDSKRPEDVAALVTKYETEKEALKQSFEAPLQAATERARQLEEQIQKSLTQTAIQKLRNEYDLNETADYVLRDFIKVVPAEEGSSQYAVKVFDNGQEALVAGQPQTPDQLIKSFQEAKKFPAMFNVGSGGGTGTTNRTTSVNNGAKYEGLSAVEKLKEARRNGVST